MPFIINFDFSFNLVHFDNFIKNYDLSSLNYYFIVNVNCMVLENNQIGWNLARSNINSECFRIWKNEFMDSCQQKSLVEIIIKEAFIGH